MSVRSIRPRVPTSESFPSYGSELTSPAFPADWAAIVTAAKRPAAARLATFVKFKFIPFLRDLDPRVRAADAEGLRELRVREADGTAETTGDLGQVLQVTGL